MPDTRSPAEPDAGPGAATEPVEAATEPVEAATEPVEAATEPVEAATEPVEAATAESLNEDLRDLAEVVRTADLSKLDLDALSATVRQLTTAIRPHVVDATRMQAFLQGSDFFSQGHSPTEPDTALQSNLKGLASKPPASIGGMLESESAQWMPYSPYSGTLNPISPPVTLRLQAAQSGYETVGSVCFRDTFNGPPDCVHGGVIAAVFDEVLGMTCLANGRGGFTGTLSVRYCNPTPLGRTVTIRSWLDRIEGRKTFVRGTFHESDMVLAEAEGIFIAS